MKWLERMVIDSARLMGSLHRDGIGLDLKTVDLCFLVALFALARQRALSCFDEETVVETFEQICELIEPGANPNERATYSIQRLRDQRLLSRVDGAGLVRAGEYTLTTLANAIVEFFLHDEALTRESLSLLTKTLLVSLSEIKAAAVQASGDEEWRLRIVGPLRVTVGDLVSGIERRQRGLDAQQEEVQRRIGELLQASWFDAVDRCQALLNDTTTTLKELNTVLLHDTNQDAGFPSMLWNSLRPRGGNSAEGGHLAADNAHGMEKGQPVGILVGAQRRFVHEAADGEVRHQQAIKLLPHQIRFLAAQDDMRAPQVSLEFVERGFNLPALVIQCRTAMSGMPSADVAQALVPRAWSTTRDGRRLTHLERCSNNRRTPYARYHQRHSIAHHIPPPLGGFHEAAQEEQAARGAYGEGQGRGYCTGCWSLSTIA